MEKKWWEKQPGSAGVGERIAGLGLAVAFVVFLAMGLVKLGLVWFAC